MMDLNQYALFTLPQIEGELKAWVARVRTPQTRGLHEILTYAMGWTGSGAGTRTRGKRIRPLLTLLAAQAAGGSVQAALPSAAAVELLHNFTLIHDDIQDRAEMRRGRPSVWREFGVPQAINAGDLLFSLANQALLGQRRSLPAAAALDALELFHRACTELTQGQYLDLAHQEITTIGFDEYWPMINGKTAALLGLSLQLGALAGGATPAQAEAFEQFGRLLGMAYQAQDDLLDVWGNVDKTGKPARSDLFQGKKSLPVVFAMQAVGGLQPQYDAQPASEFGLLQSLEDSGARRFTEDKVAEFTARARDALARARPQSPFDDLLNQVTATLLARQS